MQGNSSSSCELVRGTPAVENGSLEFGGADAVWTARGGEQWTQRQRGCGERTAAEEQKSGFSRSRGQRVYAKGRMCAYGRGWVNRGQGGMNARAAVC
jgi:hypothetical protein